MATVEQVVKMFWDHPGSKSYDLVELPVECSEVVLKTLETEHSIGFSNGKFFEIGVG